MRLREVGESVWYKVEPIRSRCARSSPLAGRPPWTTPGHPRPARCRSGRRWRVAGGRAPGSVGPRPWHSWRRFQRRAPCRTRKPSCCVRDCRISSAGQSLLSGGTIETPPARWVPVVPIRVSSPRRVGRRWCPASWSQVGQGPRGRPAAPSASSSSASLDTAAMRCAP